MQRDVFWTGFCKDLQASINYCNKNNKYIQIVVHVEHILGHVHLSQTTVSHFWKRL